MKNLLTSSLIACTLCIILLFDSCKKKSPEPTLSAKIQQIVPATLLNNLKVKGMPINEGLNPPNIEGVFVSNPHTLEVPYAGDPNSKGYVFNSLVLRFSNQNSKELSVNIDTKSSSTVASGIGGFISGTGNKFSIFAELSVQNGTATGKQVRIFSGEITSQGIKDFYSTLVFTEKNDPNNVFIEIGAARIIKDGDGLASKTNAFRMGVEVNDLIDESSLVTSLK